MRTKDPALLRRRRVRHGLSQQDLAYLCRCSQATISLLERGEMRNLSEDLARTISKRLDSDLEDLFEERTDDRVPPVARRRRASGKSGVQQARGAA